MKVAQANAEDQRGTREALFGVYWVPTSLTFILYCIWIH